MNIVNVGFIPITIEHDNIKIQIYAEQGLTYGQLFSQLRLETFPQNYQSIVQNTISQETVIKLPDTTLYYNYDEIKKNWHGFKDKINYFANISICSFTLLQHIFCIECNKTICLQCYINQHKDHQACILGARKLLQCQCAIQLHNLHLQLQEDDDTMQKNIIAIITILYNIQSVNMYDFNNIIQNAIKYKNYFIALFFSCKSSSINEIIQRVKYLNSIEDTVVDETEIPIAYTQSFLFDYLTSFIDQIDRNIDFLKKLFSTLYSYSELMTSIMLYQINYFLNEIIINQQMSIINFYDLISDIGNYFTNKHVNIASNLKLYDKILYLMLQIPHFQQTQYNCGMAIIKNLKIFKSEYELSTLILKHPICFYYLNTIYVKNTKHQKLFPYIEHNENCLDHIVKYNAQSTVHRGGIFSLVFKNLFSSLQILNYTEEIKEKIIKIIKFILKNMNFLIPAYERYNFWVGFDFDIIFMALVTIPVNVGGMKVQDFQFLDLEIEQLLNINSFKLYNTFRFLKHDSIPYIVDEYQRLQDQILTLGYNKYLIYIAIDFVKLFIKQEHLRNLINNFIFIIYLTSKQKKESNIMTDITVNYRDKNKAFNLDVFDYENKQQKVQRFMQKIADKKIKYKIRDNSLLQKQISIFCQFLHQILFQTNITNNAMKNYSFLHSRIKLAYAIYQKYESRRLYGTINAYKYAESCSNNNFQFSNTYKSLPVYIPKEKRIIEPTNLEFITQNIEPDDLQNGTLNSEYKETLYEKLQNNLHDDLRSEIQDLLKVYQYFNSQNSQNSVNSYVIERLEMILTGNRDYNNTENSSVSNLNKLKSLINKYKQNEQKNTQLLISQTRLQKKEEVKEKQKPIQAESNHQSPTNMKEGQICSICHQGGNDLMLRCYLEYRYKDIFKLPLIKFCPHLIHKRCNNQQRCPICGFEGKYLLNVNKKDIIIIIGLIYWQVLERTCSNLEKEQRNRIINHHKKNLSLLCYLMGDNGLQLNQHKLLDHDVYINRKLPNSTLDILQLLQNTSCVLCERNLSTSFPNIVICLKCGSVFHFTCHQYKNCQVCQGTRMFFVHQMLFVNRQYNQIIIAPYMTVHGQYLFNGLGDVQFLSQNRLSDTINDLIFAYKCTTTSFFDDNARRLLNGHSSQATQNQSLIKAKEQFKAQCKKRTDQSFLYPLEDPKKCIQTIVWENITRGNIMSTKSPDKIADNILKAPKLTAKQFWDELNNETLPPHSNEAEHRGGNLNLNQGNRNPQYTSNEIIEQRFLSALERIQGRGGIDGLNALGIAAQQIQNRQQTNNVYRPNYRHHDKSGSWNDDQFRREFESIRGGAPTEGSTDDDSSHLLDIVSDFDVQEMLENSSYRSETVNMLTDGSYSDEPTDILDEERRDGIQDLQFDQGIQRRDQEQIRPLAIQPPQLQVLRFLEDYQRQQNEIYNQEIADLITAERNRRMQINMAAQNPTPDSEVNETQSSVHQNMGPIDFIDEDSDLQMAGDLHPQDSQNSAAQRQRSQGDSREQSEQNIANSNDNNINNAQEDTQSENIIARNFIEIMHNSIMNLRQNDEDQRNAQQTPQQPPAADVHPDDQARVTRDQEAARQENDDGQHTNNQLPVLQVQPRFRMVVRVPRNNRNRDGAQNDQNGENNQQNDQDFSEHSAGEVFGRENVDMFNFLFNSLADLLRDEVNIQQNQENQRSQQSQDYSESDTSYVSDSDRSYFK